MSESVTLGEVELPEGILIILDPGLARFWRHDGEPSSPRKDDPAQRDLRIVGDDAEAAGRAYDREFDPLHLFDRTDAEAAKRHFDELAAKNGFSATAEVLAERVPHTARVPHALDAGGGLGVVSYNGLWGVVVGGLPDDRPLSVVGVPMPSGEFGGRWQHIDVVIDASAVVEREDEVKGVMVDHGQLLFAGLGPLGHFRMWESLDGLADYVFRGRDAEALAKEVGATALGDGHFGWVDVPLEDVGRLAQPLQQKIAAQGLAVGVDYRPHCNLEKLDSKLRTSEQDTAQIELDGSQVFGCGNRWGDGVFAVRRLFDAAGRVVRVRVALGTEERFELMRQVLVRSQAGIATRAILDDGHEIVWAERLKPNNPRDSGWSFTAGVESQAYMDDASNHAIVSIQTLLERRPELATILTSDVGSVFRWIEGRFVRFEG